MPVDRQRDLGRGSARGIGRSGAGLVMSGLALDDGYSLGVYHRPRQPALGGEGLASPDRARRRPNRPADLPRPDPVRRHWRRRSSGASTRSSCSTRASTTPRRLRPTPSSPSAQVLFEIPTGIVADTRGRRFSFLLGAATLLVATLLYLLMWQIRAPFLGWALASILLGLGFTFFSGATEAWLVDALRATGFTGHPRDRLRPGPDRQRRGDADRVRARRRRRPGDRSASRT